MNYLVALPKIQWLIKQSGTKITAKKWSI